MSSSTSSGVACFERDGLLFPTVMRSGGCELGEGRGGEGRGGCGKPDTVARSPEQTLLIKGWRVGGKRQAHSGRPQQTRVVGTWPKAEPAPASATGQSMGLSPSPAVPCSEGRLRCRLQAPFFARLSVRRSFYRRRSYDPSRLKALSAVESH